MMNIIFIILGIGIFLYFKNRKKGAYPGTTTDEFTETAYSSESDSTDYDSSENDESRADDEEVEKWLSYWHYDDEYNLRNKGDASIAEADKMLVSLFEQAEAEDEEKMQLLGEAYRTAALGLVEQDIDESYKWYSKAAALGDAESMYWVAFYKANGLGTNIDYKNAFELANQAAQLKQKPRNMRFLAMFYELGIHVEQNIYEAERCWLQALNLNETKEENDEDDIKSAAVSARKLLAVYEDRESSLCDVQKAQSIRETYESLSAEYQITI